MSKGHPSQSRFLPSTRREGESHNPPQELNHPIGEGKLAPYLPEAVAHRWGLSSPELLPSVCMQALLVTSVWTSIPVGFCAASLTVPVPSVLVCMCGIPVCQTTMVLVFFFSFSFV